MMGNEDFGNNVGAVVVAQIVIALITRGGVVWVIWLILQYVDKWIGG